MQFDVDGRSVFAATGGQPVSKEKPAVLFLHGSGMDHSVWTLQARYVAHHGGSAIAVDLPGHGKSAGPCLDTIEAMARWGWQALDALGLERATLVGHSMGALAALEMAASMSARTLGLMLVGFAPEMPVHPDLLAAAEANDKTANELVASWGFGASGHVGGNAVPGLAMLPGGLRLLDRAGPGVLYNDLTACNAYQGAAGAAPKIKCPVVSVHGDADRMTPLRKAQGFFPRLPMRAAKVLPGIGHMVMAEAPDAVTFALRDLLKG
jgi:pimeloyl-ACP methyl ester carboxylesterase